MVYILGQILLVAPTAGDKAIYVGVMAIKVRVIIWVIRGHRVKIRDH